MDPNQSYRADQHGPPGQPYDAPYAGAPPQQSRPYPSEPYPYHQHGYDAGYRQAPPGAGFRSRLRDPRFRFFCRRHRYSIIAVVIALVLAIGIMSVGFGYTVMIAIFVVIALFIGGILDGNPAIYQLLERFRS